MPNRVKLYTREHTTRKFIPANPKTIYALDTIWVLRFTVQGKRKWEFIEAKDYRDAYLKASQKDIALQLEAIKNPTSEPAPQSSDEGLMLDVAIDRYLDNVATKSSKTASGYRHTLQQFYQAVRNKGLKAITEQDLYKFVAYLRREELSDRTIHNRVGEVVTFLRHFKIKEVTLKIKYVEQKVRAYRPDELKALFAAADPEEWLLFQFFLCTGAREQEVEFAEWRDVDFVDGLFTVKAKAEWTPKDYEERELPLPDFLLATLKQRMLGTKGDLIFPTKKGKPNGHMLRKLKTLAKRAGVTGEVKLHKFRKSYATLQHRAGLDARTIQKRLGHSDLATTLAYLEGEDARSDRTRGLVNNTFAAFA
jgi:integrase